jgi:GAF domain-containing protein
MLQQSTSAIQKPETIVPKVVTHSLLATTALRIRQSVKLEDLFATTLSQLRQALSADRVLMYRIEADGSGAVLEESTSKDCQSLKGRTVYDPHFSRYWQPLYERGRIQSIADIHSAGISKCYANFLNQFQVKANLVVPILQNQSGTWEQRSQAELTDDTESGSLRLWGLLTVQQCSAPREWTPSDIDLVDQIALQMELAIQQAELCKTVQKEVALRKLAEADLSSSTKTFDDMDAAEIASIPLMDLYQSKGYR